MFALLYLDLDGFKRINDARGHAVGDAVLREGTAALRGVLRPDDLTARLGGDEFAIPLRDTALQGSAIAERVRTAIESRRAEKDWAVTASVGVVSFLASPQDVDSAIAAADAGCTRPRPPARTVSFTGSIPWTSAEPQRPLS